MSKDDGVDTLGTDAMGVEVRPRVRRGINEDPVPVYPHNESCCRSLIYILILISKRNMKH